jgi:putative phosphoesterase
VRLAAIYDIHGNLPALDAVLAEIRSASVDRVIVGGDVVPGPMPRESLTRLLDLDVPTQFITGNGERAVLDAMAGTDPVGVPEAAREAIRWTAQQLEPEHQRLMASWPQTLRVQLPGLGDVLFCHATPRSDTEIFTRLTPEEQLLPLFHGLDAALVVCGHTHMPFDRTIGGVRVLNAGSVGMPFGPPGADWLLLGSDVTFRRTTYDLRHTTYDLADAARRVRGTGYPQADEFAEHNILQPPSEAQMLEAFERAGPR